jgi:ADP-ribosylglycohydrolase
MGDCLGAGVEGMSAAAISDAHRSTNGFVRRFRLDPMVWIDDTQQALTLIEAVKRFGRMRVGSLSAGSRWRGCTSTGVPDEAAVDRSSTSSKPEIREGVAVPTGPATARP